MIWIYLGKVLIGFASPLGLAILFLLAALVLRRHPRLARTAGLAALGVLLIFGSPAVARMLLGSLEDSYPEVPVESSPNAQAIVVLGGALVTPGGQHLRSELNEASDRYLRVLRLYRAGKAPWIVCSGGGLFGEQPESEYAAGLLGEWGLPASAILTEIRSRTTAENAAFTHDLLAPKGISRILLVTSASHMNRAAALFRKVGFEVIPSAADYVTGWGEPDWLFGWLPAASALNRSGIAWKEWIGLGACRVTGAC